MYDKDLHSNMVRFIMQTTQQREHNFQSFTFQYGQIYYANNGQFSQTSRNIYIPIWLDLLYIYKSRSFNNKWYLHSNMVRFIIQVLGEPMGIPITFTFQYGQIYYQENWNKQFEYTKIYIPIWLDLLFRTESDIAKPHWNLHSNMVRFIIAIINFIKKLKTKFTFQYGQIYYSTLSTKYQPKN